MEIVRDRGALHMTMDAIAARAGISKGGLIYHFPSQRDLLRAMVMGHIQHFEAQMAHCLAHLPPGPASDIKAFIRTWFDLDEEFRRSANALLAVALREPDLIDTVRRKNREVADTILASRPHNKLVAILLLAVDGVWMSELLGIDAFTRDERRQVERTLLQLADEWAGRPEPEPPESQRRIHRHGKIGRRVGVRALRKEGRP